MPYQDQNAFGRPASGKENNPSVPTPNWKRTDKPSAKKLNALSKAINVRRGVRPGFSLGGGTVPTEGIPPVVQCFSLAEAQSDVMFAKEVRLATIEDNPGTIEGRPYICNPENDWIVINPDGEPFEVRKGPYHINTGDICTAAKDNTGNAFYYPIKPPGDIIFRTESQEFPDVGESFPIYYARERGAIRGAYVTNCLYNNFGIDVKINGLTVISGVNTVQEFYPINEDFRDGQPFGSIPYGVNSGIEIFMNNVSLQGPPQFQINLLRS